MKQRKTEKEVFLCLLSSQHKPPWEKRMVNRWTMGHARWMSVLLLVFGFRTGSCDISLTMERTVTGVKGDSVVIPCTYTMSTGDDVVKILWEFHNNPVIYRIDSEDHTPQVHNRNRAVLSNSPGDASLTLRKLDIGDRGNFKCKVTGRDKGGKAIEKEGVTILKVNRKKTDTPDVESATMEDNDFEPTRPVTERPRDTTPPAKPTTQLLITVEPDVRVSTAGGEPVTELPATDNDGLMTTRDSRAVTEIVTETPEMEAEITAEPDVTTKIVTETPEMEAEITAKQNLTTKIVTDKPEMENETTARRDEIVTETPEMKAETTAKQDLTTKIVTETPEMEAETTAKQDLTTRAPNAENDSAIVNTKQPRKFDSITSTANPLPTDIMHNDPIADAIKGSGIFFYVLIISLLCVIFILILSIVLIVRRKRRKSFHYDIPTMNQLALNLDGRPCSGGGCRSNDYQYSFPVSEHVTIPSCSNDYEYTFPVSEYVSLPACSNEYEQLIIQNPQDIDNHISPSQ